MSESMYCVYSSDKNHYCFLKETGLVLQNTELEQSGISKVLLLMGNANKWKSQNNIVNKYIYIVKICCYFMPLWIAPQGQTVLLTLNTSSRPLS